MLQIILYWVHFVLVVITVLSVLKTRKSPSSSIAWILAVTVIPVGGILVYLLLGRDRKKLRLMRRIPEEILAGYLAEPLEKQGNLIAQMAESGDSGTRRAAGTIRLLAQTTAAPVTGGNSVKTYYRGRDKFDDLLADLRRARESICMEYYIWRSDEMGERIREVLEERARSGTEVRLIFDGWGSFGSISYAYRSSLRAAGIEFAYFLDLTNPFSRFKINYRNHRKIAVIDGRIAYTGGMNIGSEYLDGGGRFESWRDTHLRITGPAVSLLQAVFLADWYNSGKKLLLEDSMFPKIDFDSVPGEGILLQIALCGPDSPWDGMRLHYLDLLNGAREEVLIQTPYFIPGEAVEKAIIAAALRGVRVIIMTVGKPDKRMPFWAAQTYFDPLLRAGAEIYRYRAGFLHSKVIIQDGLIASVGTCNVDIRSFELGYEVNTVIYSAEEAASHAEQFREDVSQCDRITLEDLDSSPLLSRFRNSVCRLLSPLM